jgi:GT2 family glycosyltransferase
MSGMESSVIVSSLSVQLSIIIVNYNTRILLRACLCSVFRQATKTDFEVIVVDNASTDGSREMLEQEFPHVTKIYNEKNRGFAAANNQAIKQAKGEYILLLNSDTEVLDGAIQKTVAFMQQCPEASIVGCKLLNADRTLQPSCRSFPSPWNLFTESFFLFRVFKHTQLFGQYYMSHFDHDSIRQVEVVMGAFMLIRRNVFETIGLFDEDYFMYAEETDFCYRARKAGYKTFFFPRVEIIHFGGGSTQDSQKQIEQLHSALLLFGIKLFTAVGLKKLGVALRVTTYFLIGVLTFNVQQIRKSRHYLRILF